MNRTDYLNAVAKEFYQGEVLGEAISGAYYRLEQDPERRRKWATLMQLETETKARLRPFLLKLGLSVAEDDVSMVVSEFAKTYATKSWHQHMTEIGVITGDYIQKFRQIEASAPDGEEREMARSMVAHEMAINLFTKMELTGDGENSLRAMEAQLQWPVSAPPSASAIFAAIRRGTAKPGMAHEFADRVRAGALPVLTQMAGFKGYYLMVGENSVITAVTLFTTKEAAETSNHSLLPWIRENLGPLMATPPDMTEAKVLVSTAR